MLEHVRSHLTKIKTELRFGVVTFTIDLIHLFCFKRSRRRVIAPRRARWDWLIARATHGNQPSLQQHQRLEVELQAREGCGVDRVV